MRCPSCHRFVSFDDSTEPEANLELEGDIITGTIRIVLTCEECGNELKEYTFDVEVDVSEFTAAHEMAGDHDPAFEFTSLMMETRRQDRDPRTGKSIPTRYQKTFYGYTMEIEINCTCSDACYQTFTIEDIVQASSMEELD